MKAVKVDMNYDIQLTDEKEIFFVILKPEHNTQSMRHLLKTKKEGTQLTYNKRKKKHSNNKYVPCVYYDFPHVLSHKFILRMFRNISIHMTERPFQIILCVT